MKHRDLIQQLEAAGYRLCRSNKHEIYKKKGSQPIQVPKHRELNEITAQEILKQAGLK